MELRPFKRANRKSFRARSPAGGVTADQATAKGIDQDVRTTEEQKVDKPSEGLAVAGLGTLGRSVFWPDGE